MKNILNRILGSALGVPLALLVLMAISYGVMIPWLGYGFDDWHFIYYATRGSQGLSEIFYYDGHLQSTWIYILSFKMLGYNPLFWHLYALLWRWAAVISFWICLKSIWHDNQRLSFFVAALFAIHPVYTLQVFPICFFEIWIGYVLLFLSFFFTIQGIQHPEKQRMFFMVAMLLAVGRIFTSEYIWFVELMRPVFIWLALPPGKLPRARVIQTARIWFFFGVIFAIALIWRGYFVTPTRKYFQVPTDLFASPGKYLLGWALDLLPDIGIVMITAWYETFRPDYIYLNRPFNIILFITAIVLVATIVAYAHRIDGLLKAVDGRVIQAVLLGLPSLVFGILPFYIASYSIHSTELPFNSRLALGMLPGVALISVALIERNVSSQRIAVLMMAIALSLSAVWHIRYTNDFRKVWLYQSGFLQQLTWRVPGIEKDTAIFVWQPVLPELDISNANISLYGDFSLAMAVNSIYQQSPNPAESRLSYWYYALSGEQAFVESDIPLHSEHATTFFEGNTSNNLFFYYDPESNRCLHLVSVEDQYYKQYPQVIKEIASHATIDRISSMLEQNVKLRDEILGGNEQTWCFYYQKAELARQYRQWDKIPLLLQEATDNNLQTEFGVEYIPFIDGFAHLAEWQKAKELTVSAKKLSKAMSSILCPLWDEIERSTPVSRGKDETINQVRMILECATP